MLGEGLDNLIGFYPSLMSLKKKKGKLGPVHDIRHVRTILNGLMLQKSNWSTATYLPPNQHLDPSAAFYGHAARGAADVSGGVGQASFSVPIPTFSRDPPCHHLALLTPWISVHLTNLGAHQGTSLCLRASAGTGILPSALILAPRSQHQHCQGHVSFHI